MTDATPLFCDRCLKELRFGQGEFYFVKIEAVLDPTPPEFTQEDLDRDVTAELDELVKHLNHLSPQEAYDQVDRKLTLFLCLECYRNWIENPTGA
jgi:hypothetical protein